METVKFKLSKFFQQNKLPVDGGYSDPWTRYSIGNVSFVVFPSFKHRVESIIRHDLHHILNDLNTSNLEEGFIAAWEVGSGCRRYWFSWFMGVQAMWFGIIRAPKKTWEYFFCGRNSANLYSELNLEEIYKLDISDFRSKYLNIGLREKTTILDFIYFFVYAFFGGVAALIFIPIVLFFAFIGFIFRL